MEVLIKKNSPVIFKALFSNPNIIVSEYHQSLILEQIIKVFISKEGDDYFDVYKYVFGSCSP
jgi:hypothetical protein